MNPWQLFALFYLLGWTYTVGLGTPDIQRILNGELKVHGVSPYRLALGMFIASLAWPYVLYMHFSGAGIDSPLISPPIQPQMPVEPDDLEYVSPPTECKPCDRYWFPAIYGPGVGEPCTRCGQPVTKQESPLSPGALTRAQQPDVRYPEVPCPEEPDIPLMMGAFGGLSQMKKERLLTIVRELFEAGDDRLLEQYGSKHVCVDQRNELADAEELLRKLIEQHVPEEERM